MRTFLGVAHFRFKLKGSSELVSGYTLKDKAFTVESTVNKLQIKTDYGKSIYKELEESVSYTISAGLPMSEEIFNIFPDSGVYEGDLEILTFNNDLYLLFPDISITVKHHFSFKSNDKGWVECVGLTKNGFTFDSPHVIPTSITFTKEPTAPLNVGDTFQLEWQIEPWNASQEVTFTTSDSSVATVSQNGVITAIANGSADITVKTSNDLTDTTSTTIVTPLPAGDVEFTMNVATDESEGTRAGYHNDGLGSIVVPDTNLTMVYSFGKNNSGTHTAYIGWEGEAFKGNKFDVYINGTVAVLNKATTYNDVSDITRISESLSESEAEDIFNIFNGLIGEDVVVKLFDKGVEPPVEPTSVAFTSSPPTIEPTDTFQLEWEVLPENADDKSVTFVSSATGVATVDANGLVTGVADGTATITIETINGITDTIDVTIEDSLENAVYEMSVEAASDWGVKIHEFYKNGNLSDTFDSISTTIDIVNEGNAIDGNSETYAEAEDGSDGWLLKAKYDESTISDFSVDLFLPTNAPVTIRWFKNGTEVHDDAAMGNGTRETFTFNM